MDAQVWFQREVLPLEAALTRFISANWRDADEVADLRHEVYVKMLESCRDHRPSNTWAYLVTLARNHLIDRVRRSRIVQFQQLQDLDLASPDRVEHPEPHLLARDELRRVQAGLETLTPRCREAVLLRKMEGLSQREAAARMGISENTLERHMVTGMRALADYIFGFGGESAPIPSSSHRGAKS